ILAAIQFCPLHALTSPNRDPGDQRVVQTLLHYVLQSGQKLWDVSFPATLHSVRILLLCQSVSGRNQMTILQEKNKYCRHPSLEEGKSQALLNFARALAGARQPWEFQAAIPISKPEASETILHRLLTTLLLCSAHRIFGGCLTMPLFMDVVG
ncbi:hypothetical protein KI387_031914, partial [Taxus chinensis]